MLCTLFGILSQHSQLLYFFAEEPDENIPVKPDPAIVYEILSQTDTSPAETLYVGDSGVDMQTARNSHLTSIGVSWGFRSRKELKENGADYIVDSPEEILEKI